MLADTTVLIDFLKGKESAVRVIKKASENQIFTTEINVFELIVGAHIAQGKKQARIEKIQSMLSKLIVLPLNRASSLKAGEVAGTLLKEGKRIEETDCLIAGIALANGIKNIITNNKKHFERIQEIEVISY